jgi:hypothetical protein
VLEPYYKSHSFRVQNKKDRPHDAAVRTPIVNANSGGSRLASPSCVRRLSPLEASTPTSGLATGAIGRDGSHVLDPADLQAVPCQRPEGRLGARAGAAGLVPARPPDLDVEGGQAEFLALLRHVLGGEHGGVGGTLVTIRLHLHPTRDADQSLPAGEIRHVDERVVEASVQVGDSEDLLPLQEADPADPLRGSLVAEG